MEGIINSVRSLFGNYGFHAAAVVLATVVVVNVVKRPLVRKAALIAEKTGVDKSVVTKNVTIIPVAVAFVIELASALIAARFNFRAVDYGAVASASVLYGALAIATYESVKKQLRAYAASVGANLCGKPSDETPEGKPADEESAIADEPAADESADESENGVTGNEDNEYEQPVFSENGG